MPMDLITALGILRRRWPIFIICMAAGLGGGFALGHHEQKRYASTAEVLINVPSTATLQEQLLGTQVSSSFVTTYASLVGSQAVQTRVQRQFASQGVTQPAGTLTANVVPQTFLINLRSTSTSPDIAQFTANAGAAALVE